MRHVRTCVGAATIWLGSWRRCAVAGIRRGDDLHWPIPQPPIDRKRAPPDVRIHPRCLRGTGHPRCRGGGRSVPNVGPPSVARGAASPREGCSEMNGWLKTPLRTAAVIFGLLAALTLLYLENPWANPDGALRNITTWIFWVASIALVVTL